MAFGWLFGIAGTIAFAADGIQIHRDGDVLALPHVFITYRGERPPSEALYINGAKARGEDGTYAAWVHLVPGTNQLVVVAQDGETTTLLDARTIVHVPGPAAAAPLADTDGDGIVNGLDLFPEDATASRDANGDGIADAAVAPPDPAAARRLLVQAGAPLNAIAMGSDRIRGATLYAVDDTRLALIRGLPIEQLTIRESPELTDLSLLAGTPIKKLEAQVEGVTNLTPLTGCALESLYLDADTLRHLGSLHGLPLTTLTLRSKLLENLDDLRGLKIQKLDVIGCPLVTNLAPLAGMPLVELEVGAGVSDLAPLAGMRLQSFICYSGGFSNLAPLRGMPLQRLEIESCPVADLSPLIGAPLKHLNIFGTDVRDLSALRTMPLESISFNKADVPAGIEALFGLPTLKLVNGLTVAEARLNLPAWQRTSASTTRMRQLARDMHIPYREIAWRWSASEEGISLVLSGFTNLTTLPPLKGLPLSSLALMGTSVADLSPLTGITIRELYVEGTPVTDLTPLAATPLEHLSVTPDCITQGWDSLRGKASLRTINGLETNAFWAIFDDGLFRLDGALDAQLAAGGGNCRFRQTPEGGYALWIRGGTNTVALPNLSGFKLNSLRITDLPTTQLPELTNNPLQELDISRTAIADLEPLRGMPLRTLTLCGTPVSNLAPLAGMPLIELDISDTPVADLEPLRGMPLTTIKLRGSRVRDISALNTTSLRRVVCDASAITAGREILIACAANAATNGATPRAWTPALLREAITTLGGTVRPSHKGGAHMEEVGFRSVTDLSPLAGAPIKALSLRGCPITDLTPLQSMPLFHLSISDSAVTDLSPLKGLKLVYLSAESLNATDLSALQGMPLRTLKLQRSRFHDLTPLAGMPLRELTLSPELIASGLDVVRTNRLIATINNKPPAQFWSQYDASHPK